MKFLWTVAFSVSSLGRLILAERDSSKRTNLRGESAPREEDERDLAFSGSSGSASQQSIVGGTAAAARPWFVQGSGCGGTLVARDFVLTAAHCWAATAADSAWPLKGTVYIGNTRYNTVTSGSEKNTIKAVFRHPSYNSNTNAWDFMLVQLNTPVSTNRTLATMNAITANPAAGASLTTMGFGATTEGGGISTTFLQVTVKTYTGTQCNSMYGGGIVDSVMICAGWDTGGKDSCQGDSGGPIVDSNNNLVGVVSFGIGCGQANYPGVYARVSAGKSWIEQIICANTLSSPKPSFCPGASTTKSPTKKPTKAPTKKPTKAPTKKPTKAPTKKPTKAPTKKPTKAPTKKPTKAPTKKPTAPTRKPTKAPTNKPVAAATRPPTKKPTAKPVTQTRAPTKKPTTRAPTKRPKTRAPTKKPTGAIPTSYPTYSYDDQFDDDYWWRY